MKNLTWIMYIAALAIACLVMLCTGVDISDWEYWVVSACVIVARVSGLVARVSGLLDSFESK